MYPPPQTQQFLPQADDPIIRGINSRLETLAHNVTRVIDVVDGGGHQGDSDEVNSRAEGDHAENLPRGRRRRQQQTTQFIEPNPGELMHQNAPPRVVGMTRSREERDGVQQEQVDRRTRHRNDHAGGSRRREREMDRNTLADPEAFRELQDQLADIQDQIHYGHRGTSNHRESPFTEDISSAQVPTDFRMPRKDMCGFGGTGDPDDHLDSYLDWMNMQGASDAVKCRVFPLTLSGDARTWYGGLKRQSISSFNELSKEFRSGFAASRRRRRHMVHLTSIRQTDTETIRDYMKRFTEAARQVKDFSEVGAVMAFTQGLRHGRLSWSLSKRGPTSYRELMERAEKYATAEDVSESKSHSTFEEPVDTHKKWGRQSRDKGKEPQTSRQVNTGESTRNYRTFREKFDHYTPMRFPLDKMLDIANKEKLLRNPEPLQTPPEKRNRKISCKFHNDHGHETRKCRDLRDQIEELVRSGKLREYVRPQESNAKTTKEEPHPSYKRPGGMQDSDDEEPINFIDSIPIMGEAGSTSAGKAPASVCLATAPEDAPRDWAPISFSTEDCHGVRYPHCDALIISVKVGNRVVKRTLIDHGSSLDIIHWDPLQKLGYTLQQLQASRYCIRGIGGHRTRPVGQIELPVRFGTRPQIRTVWVSFQVVDIPFPFNILIGRPTLYTLRASTCIYSLKIKFPTEYGTGEVSGDQEEYKRCIQIGSNPVLTVGDCRPESSPPRRIPKQRRPRTKSIGDLAEPQPSEIDCTGGNFVITLDPRGIGSYPAGEPTEELIKIYLREDDPEKTILVGANLSGDIREELTKLLIEFSDVFAWNHSDMPGIDPAIISHSLNVDPSFKPVSQRRRSLNSERNEAVAIEVNKLLEAGFIRKLDYNEWLSNVVLVRKKDGRWRMCVDFTDLNKACPKDSFPLPRIDQLVDSTSGHELLSFMDAFSGYNQIRMDSKDEAKTAFITDRGIYCYRVMPFGLKNAGATYQRLVNHIFANEIGRTMEVYVDDMLTKSVTIEEHIPNLRKTFTLLRQYQMRLNPAKCVFGVSSGKFLGYMVHRRGIEANPDKIRAVIDIQPPRRTKDIQKLNGMIVALSRFISRLTDRCLPFFKALKHKGNFCWTVECQAAFEDLKSYLQKPPMLAKPTAGETLYLYLAVSKAATSSVLIKEEGSIQKAVYYVSRSMADAETRYPDIEKLALSLIVTCRKLRPYFQSHPIVVLTSQPLRQVLQKPELAGRLTKWAIELSEFDITFKPRTSIKGQAVADFIAEYSHPEVFNLTTVNPPRWEIFVDGSSNRHGSGAGIIIKTPDGTLTQTALRFDFRATNNVAEYEALTTGIKLALNMGAEHVIIYSDSQLIVNQVNQEYQARDPEMRRYLTQVKLLMAKFTLCQLVRIPRDLNSQADALAKLASTTDMRSPRTVTVFRLPESSITDDQDIGVIIPERIENSWMTPILNYLRDGTLPPEKNEAQRIRKQAPRYLIINRALYRRGFSLPYLRCVSPPYTEQILQEVHGGTCGSHSAGKNLGHRITRQGYYWPTLFKDSKLHAQSCDRCQRTSPVPRLAAEALTPMSSPWPFSRFGVDIIGPLPRGTSDKRFAVVAIDYFTKWVEAEALKHITEANTTNFIKHSIIYRFGVPESIIADHGTQFDNNNLRKVCSDFNINLKFASPAHPQSNGQVEAVNKVIKTLLKRKLHARKGAWVEKLPEVLWAIRTTPHSATGETPYSLCFGTEAVIPTETNIPTQRVSAYNPEDNEQELRACLEELEERRDLARIRTAHHQLKVAQYHDKRIRVRKFIPGDLVLKKVIPATRIPSSGSLGDKWEGPYIVDSVSMRGAYKLKTEDGIPLKNPWNADHLKKYYP